LDQSLNIASMRGLNDGVNADITIPGNWQYAENTTCDIQTAGIGGTWQVTEKLKFGGDYIFSYGNQVFIQTGSTSTSEGGGLPATPRLSTGSANDQVRIHASYQLTESFEMYLGYEFDSLDMSDGSLVGATAGQVLTGDLPAKYNVSTFMAAVKYTW
jgi:hypothetical protein